MVIVGKGSISACVCVAYTCNRKKKVTKLHGKFSAKSIFVVVCGFLLPFSPLIRPLVAAARVLLLACGGTLLFRRKT